MISIPACLLTPDTSPAQLPLGVRGGIYSATGSEAGRDTRSHPGLHHHKWGTLPIEAAQSGLSAPA